MADASIRRLFATGISAWFLASLVLLIAPRQTGESEGISFVPPHWWLAFAAGFFGIVLHARIARLPTTAVVFAYLEPMLLLTIFALVLAIKYPGEELQTTLLGCVPWVFVFYILGFLWMLIRPSRSARASVARLVLPPILGGLAIIAFAGFPALADPSSRPPHDQTFPEPGGHDADGTAPN